MHQRQMQPSYLQRTRADLLQPHVLFKRPSFSFLQVNQYVCIQIMLVLLYLRQYVRDTLQLALSRMQSVAISSGFNVKSPCWIFNNNTCITFINIAVLITFIVEDLCCFYEKILMLGKGEWDPIVFFFFLFYYCRIKWGKNFLLLFCYVILPNKLVDVFYLLSLLNKSSSYNCVTCLSSCVASAFHVLCNLICCNYG